MPPPTDFVPLAEIARRQGRSTETIKRWIRTGFFPGYHRGTVYVVTTGQYERFVRGEWSPERTEDGTA